MPDLSSNSQKKLLELAHKSIESQLATGGPPHFDPDSSELQLKRGCFVTLYLQKKLRGCVGTFDVREALYKNVMRMAAASAFQDTRFLPVTKAELPLIKIQLSVLGELKKMNSLEELEIGRHGVLVRYGSSSGTYLPEVAVEMKWSGPEFITRCAREKAGLTPVECASAEVSLYEVEKFSE